MERTKCCRTDFGPSLSVPALSPFLLHSFCCRVSRRLALFRGSSVYVRQHLRPAFLFCASKRTEIGICPPPCSLVSYPRPIAGCNLLFIYLLARNHKFIFVCLCLPVPSPIRVLCLLGRVPVCSTVPRNRFSVLIGSLSFSSLACSSVQDPRGPASVSHALANNPDILVNPT